MTDDGTITNRMLLEHQQAMKRELTDRITALEERVDRGFTDVNHRFMDVDRRFDEARRHREGLQEDLEATMMMQYRHEKELAVLTGRPEPEEY